MFKEFWGMFLDNLVKRDFMIFLGACSILMLIVSLIHGVSWQAILLSVILPWALYAMCSLIIAVGMFIVLLCLMWWSKK